MELAAVATRLLQYLAASAVGGASLFFVYGWSPPQGLRWPRDLVRLGALAGVVGAAGWLAAKAVELTGAADPASTWSVAIDTSFGRMASARLALLAIALSVALVRPCAWRILAALGLGASLTFAWTGHGASDDGAAGLVHLAADLLHILAAAVWLGALLALSGMVARRTRDPAALAGALDAFSRIGVAVVLVVLASGLVNSWFLVGPAGVNRLLTTTYGQLLTAKLALFALMLGLAAANRYLHTARLQAGAPGALRATAGSVAVETLAGTAVLLLVSWLGALAPIAHG